MLQHIQSISLLISSDIFAETPPRACLPLPHWRQAAARPHQQTMSPHEICSLYLLTALTRCCAYSHIGSFGNNHWNPISPFILSRFSELFLFPQAKLIRYHVFCFRVMEG